MSAEAAITALRNSCAVTRLDHVHALRLSGPGALDLLDAATTGRLFARENQMLLTLLLDARGLPFADAFVSLDEDSWLVLAEGPGNTELLAHLDRVRRERTPAADVSITDLLKDHVLWGIDGPYAWELTSALLGPEIVGAPYLSFLKLGDITCFRAGKTGEYGYMLLVPRALERATWARLQELGAPLGLVEGDVAALDLCALENWHFTMRALSRVTLELGPAELQLHWRVDLDKDFEGAAALRERRAGGTKVRLTSFVAKSAVTAGDDVTLDGQKIGVVADAGFSPTRGDWVGWAALDVGLAWPGIERFVAGTVPILTASPPLIDNRSLFVDPRKHRYRTREQDVFPPLVSR
jgi:glycine cleavage system aminomethyltransferase T